MICRVLVLSHGEFVCSFMRRTIKLHACQFKSHCGFAGHISLFQIAERMKYRLPFSFPQIVVKYGSADIGRTGITNSRAVRRQ